jgi:hypothetical protein
MNFAKAIGGAVVFTGIVVGYLLIPRGQKAVQPIENETTIESKLDSTQNKDPDFKEYIELETYIPLEENKALLVQYFNFADNITTVLIPCDLTKSDTTQRDNYIYTGTWIDTSATTFKKFEAIGFLKNGEEDIYLAHDPKDITYTLEMVGNFDSTGQYFQEMPRELTIEEQILWEVYFIELPTYQLKLEKQEQEMLDILDEMKKEEEKRKEKKKTI